MFKNNSSLISKFRIAYPLFDLLNALAPLNVDASEDVFKAVVLFVELTKNPVIFADNLDYFMSL
mgnify:CR=1 FL=1